MPPPAPFRLSAPFRFGFSLGSGGPSRAVPPRPLLCPRPSRVGPAPHECLSWESHGVAAGRGGLSESAHPRPTPGEASAEPRCGADGAATPDGAVCRLVVASHFLSAPLELSPEARGNGESWGQGEKPRPEPLFCSPPTAGVGERQLPTGTRLPPASPCRRFQGLSP